MNFRQSTPVELGLLLKGVRSIYVKDHESTRQHLIKRLETELSSRGMRLPEDDEKIDSEAERVALVIDEHD